MKIMPQRSSLNVIINVLINLSHDCYVTTGYIGEKTGYSSSGIEQAVACLSYDGYLISRKGRNGGYRLTKPLDMVTMRELSRYTTKQHRVLTRALYLLGDMPVTEFVNNKSVL